MYSMPFWIFPHSGNQLPETAFHQANALVFPWCSPVAAHFHQANALVSPWCFPWFSPGENQVGSVCLRLPWWNPVFRGGAVPLRPLHLGKTRETPVITPGKNQGKCGRQSRPCHKSKLLHRVFSSPFLAASWCFPWGKPYATDSTWGFPWSIQHFQGKSKLRFFVFLPGWPMPQKQATT